MGHLSIEEFNYPLQGIGNFIRRQQQAQTICSKIRGHSLPQTINVRFLIPPSNLASSSPGLAFFCSLTSS